MDGKGGRKIPTCIFPFQEDPACRVPPDLRLFLGHDKCFTSEIILSDGAVFSGRLDVPGSKLRVESGVSAQFDSITCDEITVEGQVKLGTSLAAEKIAVLNGGSLTSPVVRAARIEVGPGSTLQALVEKYVPRETPKEPEPEAVI